MVALGVLSPGVALAQVDETEDRDLGPIVGATTPPIDGLEGGSIGYEVGLSASTGLLEGRDATLAGVAYEIAGLDELRRTRGLEVEVSLIARASDVPDPAHPERLAPFVLVERAPVTTGEGGTFTVSIPVPTRRLVQPILVVRVGRPGRPHRRWSFPVSIVADVSATLLTDRLLYEAGETLHAWMRVLDGESGGPLAGRALRVTVTDGAGRVWSEMPVTTRASGAVSVDVPLAGSLGSGAVRIIVDDVEGAPERSPRTLASAEVQVGVRHLERMRVALGLDRSLLSPGDQLTGMVQVVAADSTPIAGADVIIEDDGNTTAALVTDVLGQVRFSIPTASYLSGDVATHSVSVRVSHPAHGTASDGESYTLARTPYFVTVLPEMGALPIELTSDLYVQVANARGEPAPAGLSVEVTGASIVGSGRVVTEAFGVARVRARVPRNAAASASGGECGGAEAATAITVAVQRDGGGAPREVSLCVPVARDVAVTPHLSQVLVAPGGTLDVTLERAGARTPVLVELTDGRRPRAYRFVGPSESTTRFTVPDRAHGVWQVSVQPLTDDDLRGAIDAFGATWAQRGGTASFVVRPPDPFEVTLTTDAPAYMVRGTVIASIATDLPPAGAAWATLLVRDEAWHAGEVDYALYSWTGTMRELIARPTAATDLALRHALAASAAYDEPVVGELPVEIAAWAADGIWAHSPAAPRSVLLDPLSDRERLRRQTFPELAVALEQALAERASLDPEMASDLVERRGGRPRFRVDALEAIGSGEPTDLGGRPLTPADVERAQIGFSFDVAASRVARRQLVTLMAVLAQVGGTADPTMARRYAVEPPERWLALAAHDGLVAASLLLDPWGRPFVFRDAGARLPAIVVSERAARWELLSAGPDGTYGNADDIRDPFARVVPAGSIYAERCGENALIAELSRIAPGPTALQRMAEAYDELGLAAEDERVPSAVYAYASEAYEESNEADFHFGGGGSGMGTIGLGDIGTIGHGSGSGYGSGYGGMGTRSSSRPSIRMGSATLVAASALARVVREEFPATLRFIAEIELDAQGRASTEIELADAVSTYRLETIVWSQSGWTSSALTRITVDQPVQIDAPIPERARVGDRIAVPVRIVNRSDVAVRVRPTADVEGDVALSLSALDEVEVPPHDGVALTLMLRASEVGRGAVRVEALAPDGTRLDAVRRPIDVRADARPWTREVDALLEDGGTLTLDVPSDALDGSGEVRMWLASQLFGTIDGTSDVDAAVAAWLATTLGRPVPEPAIAALVLRLPAPDAETPEPIHLAAGPLATMVGGLWTSEAMSDEACGILLRHLAELLDAGNVGEPVGALLGLTPAIAHRDARPALAEVLGEVVDGLRDAAAAAGAAATESPETWAHVAAALALAGDSEDHARIDEMLRRLDRHLIRVSGDAPMAWLEPDVDDGRSLEPRGLPTALYVLALIGRGRPADAMPAIRALVSMRDAAGSWPTSQRALCIAAMALIAPAGAAMAGEVRVTLDGTPLPANEDGWSFAMTPATAGSPWAVPGIHTLAASMPPRAMVLASIRSEHAVPWDRTETRTLPVALSWHGETGARDTRSALYLEVRNRSPRVLMQPTIDLQLPTGAELDVEARALLGRAGRVETTPDGVRITLRPIRVGGVVRIALRARWSLAGSLRGLGVVLRDGRAEPDRVAVLPSTDVEIPETGDEPSYPDDLGF